MQQFGKLLYNHNPFYLFSVGFVLYGLRIIFQDMHLQPEHAWKLAACLAGYTALLGSAAWLIVRYGRVWDDARTILLLIALMFGAISISFDELCVTMPSIATKVLCASLVFAVLTTETMIRTLGMRFPLLYRMPLYATYVILFLFPLSIRHSWWESYSLSVAGRVYLFSWLAALIPLMLVPAGRRVAEATIPNGTPWSWPWFPWSLFVFLAMMIAGRAYLLTLSFQTDIGLESSFGIYYLFPFGLTIAVLLAEMAIAHGSMTLKKIALAIPVALFLGSIPLGSSFPYEEFLRDFTSDFGSPLWVAWLGCLAYFAYLAIRRLPGASWGLTGMLFVGSLLNPATLRIEELHPTQAWSLLAAAMVQVIYLIRSPSSGRFLTVCLIVIASATLHWRYTAFMSFRGAIPIHLVAGAFILSSVLFADRFALLLRRFIPVSVSILAIFVIPMFVAPQSHLSSVCIYLGVLSLISFIVFWLQSNVLWKLAFYCSLLSTTLMTLFMVLSVSANALPRNAICLLASGAFCFLVGIAISLIKGRVGWSLIERIRSEWLEMVKP